MFPRVVRSSVAAIITVVIVGACGPAAVPSASGPAGPSASTVAQSSAAPTADARRVELTFMNWYYGPGDQESYDKIIADYKARDPRLTNVAIEVQPFDRYHDVLNVKMAGGHPPDLAWIDLSLGRAYVESGRLVNLRPILDAIPDWNVADFTEGSLAAWATDDGLYALPFTNATNVTYYNVDAFEKAGLPTPEEMVKAGTWNWESVRTVSKQLVDSGASKYGFMLANGPFGRWTELIEAWSPYGGAPWTEDGKTCTMDSAETIAATQLIHDMVYKDQSYPPPGADVDFPSGAVAMAITRAGQFGDEKEFPFRWGVVSQPDGPKGYVPSVAQNGFAVFDGPNADIAAQLLASMLSFENMRDYPVFPPGNRKSLLSVDYQIKAVPQFTKDQAENTVVKALLSPNAVLEYHHPNFGPILTTSQRIFDADMWKADAAVGGVLRNVCENIKDLLG